MMRADIFRATAAAIVLIAIFVGALAAVNRQPSLPPDVIVAPATPPQGLAAELRRCDALGPQAAADNAEDAHCRAVWEENRRHFFGDPTRSGATSAEPKPPAGMEARP